MGYLKNKKNIFSRVLGICVCVHIYREEAGVCRWTVYRQYNNEEDDERPKKKI